VDIQETTQNVDRFIPLDLSDSSSIIDSTQSITAPLDGLCNIAGLPPREGLEAKILQVNFIGQREFTMGLLPSLTAGASVINMASRAGHGWPQNIEQVRRLSNICSLEEMHEFVTLEELNATQCYNLSKQAMILWTFAETERFIQRGLRINSLSPGGISTGILDDFKKAFGDQMARNVERAGRPGEALEVAEVAAFVLSPNSHWLKGADIPIDGGMGAFGLSDKLALNTLQTDHNR